MQACTGVLMFAQFCCESKSALKKYGLFKKQGDLFFCDPCWLNAMPEGPVSLNLVLAHLPCFLVSWLP